MANFSVKTNTVKSAVKEEEQFRKELQSMYYSVNNIANNLSFQIASKSRIRSRLNAIAGEIYDCSRSMNSMSTSLSQILGRYENYERRICSQVFETGDIEDIRTPDSQPQEEKTKKQGVDWWEGLWSLISGAGPVGSILAAIGNVITGNRGTATVWGEFIKGVGSGIEDIIEIIGEAKNAKSGTSVSWVKKLFSLNKVDGVGDCVKVSGAGVLFSAIASMAENYDEYKRGEITAKRALAETVLETVIDVGKGVVVTAIVSSVAGAIFTGGVPVIAVGVASALVIWGADILCNSLFEKKVNDIIADCIINPRETIGAAVKTVKNKLSTAWGAFTSRLGFA